MGEISASADPFYVKHTYTALELVIKNLRAINKLRAESPTALTPAVSDGIDDNPTTITWEWVNAEAGIKPREGSISTTSLDDIYSIVVPLALSDAFAAGHIKSIVSFAGVETTEDDPILFFEPPPRDLRALMTVCTGDFEAKERSPNVLKYRDKDVITLPRSPARFGVRAGTTTLASASDKANRSFTDVDQKQLNLKKDYQRDKTRMTKWVISEDAIAIECRRYVFIVMVLALYFSQPDS